MSLAERLARPLLERLFPDLAFVRQPLAGEVAIRRSALDGLVLEPGYGVEVGMLIDVARRFGPSAIAQAEVAQKGKTAGIGIFFDKAIVARVEPSATVTTRSNAFILESVRFPVIRSTTISPI